MIAIQPAQNLAFLTCLSSVNPAPAIHTIATLASEGAGISPQVIGALAESIPGSSNKSALRVRKSLTQLTRGAKPRGTVLLTTRRATDLLQSASALDAAGRRQIARAAELALAGAAEFVGASEVEATLNNGGQIEAALPSVHYAGSKFIIPQVMKIRKNGRIPESVLKRYDSRSIAESVVARMRKTRSRKPSEHNVKLDLAKSRIKIFFDACEIEAIVKGGILNVHQTGEGTFSYRGDTPAEYASHRSAFEDAVAELKTNDPRIRPKYGILEIYDPAFLRTVGVEGGLHGIGGENYFGGIAAVLKDDSKRRATFTLHDSLNGLYEKESGPSNSNTLRASVMVFDDGLASYDLGGVDYEYAEAQVWGEIGLEDIEYFIIGEDRYLKFMDGVKTDAALKKLRRTGIPVYRKLDNETPLADFFSASEIGPLIEAEDALRVGDYGYWIKGKMLYDGDPQKILELEMKRRRSRKGFQPPVTEQSR